MLHRHLRAWVEELDERNFRVRLRENRNYAANREFEEDGSSEAVLDGVLQRAVDARLRALGIRPGPQSRVLDVCTGRGHLGRVIAEKYGAQVTCTDLSVRQLSRVGGGRIASRAVCADLLHLPYPSDTFDLVIGHSFLHHLPDVAAALTEMSRVTCPEGELVLLHEPNLNASYWESFPLSLLKDTSPMSGFTDLWLFAPDDLRRLLSRAGLECIRIAGTGRISGMLLNWHLLVLGKAGMAESRLAIPGYVARLGLNALEAAWWRDRWLESAPSLLVRARKPPVVATGGRR